MGTVEKLTLENMGVAFGILFLGGTGTEIHLGGHLPPPPIATYVLKNTIATLGLTRCCQTAWHCRSEPCDSDKELEELRTHLVKIIDDLKAFRRDRPTTVCYTISTFSINSTVA